MGRPPAGDLSRNITISYRVDAATAAKLDEVAGEPAYRSLTLSRADVARMLMLESLVSRAQPSVHAVPSGRKGKLSKRLKASGERARKAREAKPSKRPGRSR